MSCIFTSSCLTVSLLSSPLLQYHCHVPEAQVIIDVLFQQQLSTPVQHHVLLDDSIACSFRAADQRRLLLNMSVAQNTEHHLYECLLL